MDGSFGKWLRQQAKTLGIKVIEIDALTEPSGEPGSSDQADDIILLSPTVDLIEKASAYLAYKGVLAFSIDKRLERKADIDIGRVHYNRWLFLGGKDKDIAKLLNRTPVRSKLKKGGKALFVGAGGPMGRMHVQHAVESSEHPAVIVCSDVSNERLESLENTYGAEAKAKGIQWQCVNPIKKEKYQISMAEFKDNGFDDIIMLAPIPAVIADAAQWLGRKGVMNVFAGVGRGTTAPFDLNEMITKDVRVIGHSASAIEDMITMLNKVETGELSQIDLAG